MLTRFLSLAPACGSGLQAGRFWRRSPGHRRSERTRAQFRLEGLEDRCLLSITELPTPTAQSGPFGITAGPDGNLWFTEQSASNLGRVDATTHAISEFPTFYSPSGPMGIAAGPDGNLWFTEGAGSIGAFNPTTHVDTEVVTGYGDTPAITAGPDGNLWFTSTSGFLGIVTTKGGFSEVVVPILGGSYSTCPEGIAAGPDGGVWFADLGNNAIGRVDPTTDAITLFPVPTANAAPFFIVAGPDGNLWFTERDANKIGVLNPTTHAVNEFPVPTASSGPEGIAAGPDGNLWFTEFNAGRIATINPTTHAIAESVVPYTGSGPNAITAGPDGNIWFTDPNNNAIGFDALTSAHFTVTQQPPASVTAGSAFGFTVQAEDGSGNLLSSFNGTVTVALSNNPGGATLGGTLAVTASNGVATFSGLTVTKAASGYTLATSGGGFGMGVTNAITVSPAAPTQVVITQQPPATVKVNTGFGLQAAIEDQYGNLVTTATNTVKVAFAKNPTGATLGGTLSVTANQGAATFSNLTINKTGSGYTLQVSSSGLSSAITNPINVTRTGKSSSPTPSPAANAATGLLIAPLVLDRPDFFDTLGIKKRSRWA
jgi:streptogramin lyase